MKAIISSCAVLAFLCCLSVSIASPTCSEMRCPTACCDMSGGGVCFDTFAYTCNPNLLCPKTHPLACGGACYKSEEYFCSNGQLMQASQQGSTAAPTQAPPTQTPSTSTRAPTSAPPTPTPSTTTSTTRAPTPTPSTTTTTTTTTTPAPSTTTTRAPSTTTTTQGPTSSPSTPTGTTPVHGWCASRTDCAATGLMCCETTHPANMETESECYDPAKFGCFEKVMCLKPNMGCGFACYDPTYLKCTNGNLGPI